MQIKQSICFKQKRALFTLSGKLLKFADHFIYLGSKILSTESDVNIRQAKAWNTNDMLSIIQNSDLSDKIRWNFF